MNETKKVVGINLLVLLVYNIIVHLMYFEEGKEKGLSILFALLFVVGIHVIINLLLWITYNITSNPKLAKAYLISSGIVLLVGFSSCWANAAI